MCCFSFHPVKHVTTGEGGAVTTNDPALAAKLRRFRTHGITRDPRDLIINEGPWYYEQLDLGFNYRITDFQCALGMSQLERLNSFVDRRRAIAAMYDVEFADARKVTALKPPPTSHSSYHLYVIRVNERVRRDVFEGLRRAGIGVNVHYIPVYRHPYYRANGFEGFSLPNAEHYYKEAVTIPLHPRLTDAEVRMIADEVRRQVAAAA
jgi:dTDP-4-amino-4,6-dideoxygalactose transaminase